LIRAARSSTWTTNIENADRLMRAEMDKIVTEIEQVLSLLRRHL